MKPYYSEAGITIYHGDCRAVLPAMRLRGVLLVTDPPYRTNSSGITQRGPGVAPRVSESRSVGEPWGYSLDWIDAAKQTEPVHSIIFCNYAMLGDVCGEFPPSAVFVWRKSNAPRMARPVPRLDCEFIVWSRSADSSCGRMGEFQTLVLDVPMPQAGCFATERFVEAGTGKALHPCQKPLAVVQPFLNRLSGESDTVLDPFAGTGTTLVAAQMNGLKAVGVEMDEAYCEIAANRLRQGVLFGCRATEAQETRS